MKTRLFIVSASALGILSCHTQKIEYPTVPPVTVRPTAAPEGKDYTQKLLQGERGLRKRLAVARFEDNFPVDESPFGNKQKVDILAPGLSIHSESIATEGREVPASFTAKIIDALNRTRRFILIERKDINSILREIQFGETKWVDKEESAKVGKIVGAQMIVTGALQPNDDPYTKDEGRLLLLLRIYDVETSRIVGTARAWGSTEQEVVDRAASEIVQTMDKTPWVGKIASVSGKKAYLNAGTNENVQVGDLFTLFSLGGTILDPDSKEVIGYDEELAGKAEVTAVADRVATLKILEQKRPVKVGDKAQPQGE